MGATERVRQFIDYKGITKYKFCKDLGFSNKFLDNSSNMGTDKACKILHYHPEINSEWLLTGKGKMLKQEKKVTTTEPLDERDFDLREFRDAVGLSQGEFAKEVGLSSNTIERYEELGRVPLKDLLHFQYIFSKKNKNRAYFTDDDRFLIEESLSKVLMDNYRIEEDMKMFKANIKDIENIKEDVKDLKVMIRGVLEILTSKAVVEKKEDLVK